MCGYAISRKFSRWYDADGEYFGCRWLTVINIKQETNMNDVNTQKLNIDVDIVANLKEMMGDAYINLVDTYVSRSSELRDDIVNNVDDVEKLIRDVHNLKGSSGTMGAKGLFTLCESFEELLKRGEKMNKKAAIKKISDELSLAHEYLMN